MAIRRKQKPLGQLLKELNLITQSQLDQALAVQSKEAASKPLGRIMVEAGYVTEKDVLNALGAQVDKEVVDLSQIVIPPEVIARLSASLVKVYRAVPIKFADNALTVAISDPLNLSALDDLAFTLNCKVKPVLASGQDIEAAIEKFYGGEKGSPTSQELEKGVRLEEAQIEKSGKAISEIAEASALQEMADQPPVVRLVNLIFLQAVRDRASDIHIEPFEKDLKVRYRVDGVLYEMAPPPRELALALTSRIKVMARLNIAERRLPQDGRMMVPVTGKNIDIRVSTLPTVFGESVVLRILDKSVVSLSLEELGLGDEIKVDLRTLIEKPNGIILATGPTGCGKTTTLYSCLREINKIDYKIITTEDPVEYDLPGVIQVQINDKIGLSFSRCLRSIVRQDPDIIMVGEVRDLDTLQISIQASLTGHLVFSTIHTNDAAGTITRLLDMGAEPFLLTSTLEGILGQRLVRTICPKCKEVYHPNEEVLSEIDLKPKDIEGKILYYGKGCAYCNQTGYRGRTGIFELLILHDELRRLIMERASTAVLREAARSVGMKTLREDGMQKIFAGITSIEEVIRETLGYKE